MYNHYVEIASCLSAQDAAYFQSVLTDHGIDFRLEQANEMKENSEQPEIKFQVPIHDIDHAIDILQSHVNEEVLIPVNSHCEDCNAETVPEYDECNSCGQHIELKKKMVSLEVFDLEHVQEAARLKMEKEDGSRFELVTVATFTTQTEAEFYRTILSNQEIQSYLENAELVGTAWHLGNAVGDIKLQVRSTDVEQTQEILDSHPFDQQETRIPVSPVCEACGAETEPDYPSCWSCGHKIELRDPVPVKERSHPTDEIEESDENFDDLVHRAWLLTMLGFLVCPGVLHLCSLSVLWKIPSQLVSDSHRWEFRMAWVIDVLLVLLIFGGSLWYVTESLMRSF